MEEINMIETELAALEAKRAALNAALEEKRHAQKAITLDEIAKLIQDAGLTAEDIIAQFAKSKPARRASAPSAARVVFRDAVTGKEYKGGKLPGWLTERLSETGLGYEAYREQFLSRVN